MKSASSWLKRRFFSGGKSRLGPPRTNSGIDSDDSAISTSPSHVALRQPTLLLLPVILHTFLYIYRLHSCLAMHLNSLYATTVPLQGP